MAYIFLPVNQDPDNNYYKYNEKLKSFENIRNQNDNNDFINSNPILMMILILY
jgi:hypothetical protein